jgi:hypothetical protein
MRLRADHLSLSRRLARSRRAAAAAVLAALACGPARAGAGVLLSPPPEYTRSVWIRIGLTSEGRVTFGAAFDELPLSAGVEVSPRSPTALVRVFAGLKDGVRLVNSCSVFARVSGMALMSFGPKQPVHFGLRLGGYFEHTRMADAANPGPTYPRVGEGASYQLSWLAGTAFIHDLGVAVGPYWTPRGYCQSE